MSWLYEKNDNFTCFNMLILCMWLQVINKVKVTHHGEDHITVTHHGEDHITVKVQISTYFTFYGHLFGPCIYFKKA